jgi:hypothetical protein
MDNDKSNRLVSKLLTAARTIQGTSLGNEISNIVTEENPDAVTLANTITRISPAPNDTFLPIRTVKDLLQPHLQARIGLDQIEATQRMSRSATFLGWSATIFSFVQAACALYAIYKTR